MTLVNIIFTKGLFLGIYKGSNHTISYSKVLLTCYWLP